MFCFLIHQPYSPESNLVGLRITRFFFFILSNCARGMPQRWGDVSRSIYSAALRGNQFQKTQKLNRAGWICDFFKMILGMLEVWTLICCLLNEYGAVLVSVLIHRYKEIISLCLHNYYYRSSKIWRYHGKLNGIRKLQRSCQTRIYSS